MSNSCESFNVENITIKKKFVLLFVFILLIGVVSSSGNWGDISSGDEGVDGVVHDTSGTVNEDDPVAQNEQNFNNNELPSFLQNRKYTYNFYIALGISVLGILIMFFFLFLFIRNPKNKWNKKEIKKKHPKKKKLKK